MERGNVTTPFGRRAMTFGMLASQITAGRVRPEQSIDKWKLFRSICEAKTVIGVSDRSLAVLNALLSFSPGAELSRENGLIVFPSNAQLALRTHGMAGTTLRRHLACLVEAGLIIRRDSPNGKRYARKNRSGTIGEAFGFDLSPLLARAEEFNAAAAELAAEKQHLRLMRERLSLCRRDILKLLELLRETASPLGWQPVQERFQALAASLPRKATPALIETQLAKLATLRDELTNQLEILLKSQKTDASERQNGCHIQNSQPDSPSESERGLGRGEGTPPACERGVEPEAPPVPLENYRQAPSQPIERLTARPAAPCARQIPLPTVLSACPQIADYAPAGRVSNWKDLMTAAIVVRTMLNVSQDAYQDACSVLGYENAATVIACILERSDHINSPGAYLRDLTRRAKQQAFSIAPMISALSRARRASPQMTS
ncbi:replication initiation protein RepC [Sinorhizobium kostiense]|uniref:Replication initiation protein RepC n=1 Tax=Sinorhizobium kostiense TaxID=76747 RepID=A0ABS4QTQ0_9HYPH|nr:plasmid replication protein RepC [Sinorhizobium kostiense]MBP2234031.1 replication initiation protein RepC [Sinorhizobium kostiense]